MNYQDVLEKNKLTYNRLVSHPLQSFEWGEFRRKTGITVIRKEEKNKGRVVSGFQLTLHKIPHTNWNMGYLPKGNLPTNTLLEELETIGKANNCIAIQLEPNIIESPTIKLPSQLKPSVHPLFTKYTFILDITKSEEELLATMHSKTRYNIRVAKKHNVEVKEDNSDKAFQTYLTLTQETTKRQEFYAHTPSYHKNMWETLRVKSSEFKIQKSYDELTAHLFLANYQNIPLVAWVLFVFKDTLYYPYGASSTLHRETMASNLMMWEAIRFGKKLGLSKFDMWGALGPEPDASDPWYGFHKFKQGYGATLTSHIGSYDLVINPTLYSFYTIADKLRWSYLAIKRKFT